MNNNEIAEYCNKKHFDLTGAITEADDFENEMIKHPHPKGWGI